MKPPILSRPVAWGILILLGMAVLLPAQELPAQSNRCTTLDKNDQPRDCTFLEEHGKCIGNAMDSWDQCWEDADGFFHRIGCDLSVQVDLLACNFGLPWRLFRSIIS